MYFEKWYYTSFSVEKKIIYKMVVTAILDLCSCETSEKEKSVKKSSSCEIYILKSGITHPFLR